MLNEKKPAHKFYLLIQIMFGNIGLYLITDCLGPNKPNDVILILLICFFGLVMTPILPSSVIFATKMIEMNQSIVIGFINSFISLMASLMVKH